MRRLLVGVTCLLLQVGCGHRARHEAKADYHHVRAQQEWNKGDPIDAAKHKAKETREEIKSDVH